MATETVPFDATKYLDTEESQTELLSDAFESGEASYIVAALGVVARAQGRTKMEEIDIYRAANELIRQHGDKAPIHAAMRADELAEKGDEEGYAVWKRIVAAIDELLARSNASALH